MHEEDDLDRGVNLGFRGPQFSRGFDALKVWVSLLAHGRKAYARRIEHDIELTRYLAARVDEHPDFELARDRPLDLLLPLPAGRHRRRGGA